MTSKKWTPADIARDRRSGYAAPPRVERVEIHERSISWIGGEPPRKRVIAPELNVEGGYQELPNWTKPSDGDGTYGPMFVGAVFTAHAHQTLIWHVEFVEVDKSAGIITEHGWYEVIRCWVWVRGEDAPAFDMSAERQALSRIWVMLDDCSEITNMDELQAKLDESQRIAEPFFRMSLDSKDGD